MILERIRKLFHYQMPRLGRIPFRIFSAIFRGKIDCELFQGIHVRLDMSDQMQQVIFWQGTRYEAGTHTLLRKWCSGATAFFDIGANAGFSTYSVASENTNLPIYSFDPNPTLFALMQETKTRNNLTHIVPVHAGLSDKQGTLTLHLGNINSGHSTFGPHPTLTGAKNSSQDVDVPVTTFDDWCAKEGIAFPEEPEWVAKIDVEGYEVKVLKGMREALAARAFRFLCVEVNPFTLSFCAEKPNAIMEIMANLQYIPFDEHMDRISTLTSWSGVGNIFFIPEKGCELRN
jgi:FkbM family methyltransferase